MIGQPSPPAAVVAIKRLKGAAEPSSLSTQKRWLGTAREFQIQRESSSVSARRAHVTLIIRHTDSGSQLRRAGPFPFPSLSQASIFGQRRISKHMASTPGNDIRFLIVPRTQGAQNRTVVQR